MWVIQIPPAGRLRSFRAPSINLGTPDERRRRSDDIGKSYKEALQKAVRSLEIGRYGLGFARDFHGKTLDELLAMLSEPTSERQFILYEALRKGADIGALCALTHIKPYFLQQMRELVLLEEEILEYRGGELPTNFSPNAKKGRPFARPLPWRSCWA